MFLFFFFTYCDPIRDTVRSGPIPILLTPPKVHIFALETQYFSCCLLFITVIQATTIFDIK